MNRREALRAATVLVGGVLITSTGVLTACAPERRKAAPGVLTLDDQELIEDIADTLLPPTPASPGAKAAGVGATINLLLTDCYEPEVQRRVLQGLQEVRAICHDRCGTGFASLAPLERERLLREIDADAQHAGEAHWFGITRELALHAYFSSEVGRAASPELADGPSGAPLHRAAGCSAIPCLLPHVAHSRGPAGAPAGCQR